MIRVLLADDHRLFRQGVKRLLEEQADIRVVAEADNGEEAAALVREHDPNLVLLDVLMPGRGGLESLEEIKRLRPRTKVVLVTSLPEEQYAIRAFKAGADGYITKDRAADDLIQAVRRTMRGEKYVSPSLAQFLATSIGTGFAGRPHEKLSNRELQVLRLIASGKTVSEIGEDLHLSVKTVSTYRTRILEKLNLRNNAEIMRYAVDEGIDVP